MGIELHPKFISLTEPRCYQPLCKSIVANCCQLLPRQGGLVLLLHSDKRRELGRDSHSCCWWGGTRSAVRSLPSSGLSLVTALTRARDDSRLLVDLAFFHHELNILEQLDVFQRIAAHRDHIRRLPRLYRPD